MHILITIRGIITFPFTKISTVALVQNESALHPLLHEEEHQKCNHSFLELRLRNIHVFCTPTWCAASKHRYDHFLASQQITESDKKSLH